MEEDPGGAIITMKAKDQRENLSPSREEAMEEEAQGGNLSSSFSVAPECHREGNHHPSMEASQMTTTIFSTIVIMLLSSAIAAQSSGDVGGKPKPTDFMVGACKNVSNFSRGHNEGDKYVSQEFCISTLQSDNRSANAKNLHDLALIPVDILKERVVTAGGNVKNMLHNTKNSTSSTARHLRICELDYAATASILNFCDALMRNYQGERSAGHDDDKPLFSKLPECVDKVYEVSSYCAIALLDMPGAEALLKESHQLDMLINLSIALLAPYKDLES
ncbi:unnamed protein product [Triticum turgidum subsp. durum]|uniref:Pectinesterase inhibitor domain-containing protein n=4 Tax=Triticum TaxID=4564 RepID=A0A9R0TX01_TRITD|nr:unnamed protein product [Triticum turgidum subsp. durum]